MEAAQRLRPLSGRHRQSPVGGKSNASKCHLKYPVKNDLISKRDADDSAENDIMQKKKVYQNYDSKDAPNKVRNEKSARDKLEKCQNSQIEQKKNKPERDVPSKKFYFGMEGNNNNEIKTVNNYLSTNNVDKTNAEHRITAVEKSKNLMNLYKSVAEGSQEWEDSVDKFAASFHKSQTALPNGNTTSCSSSFVSDPDEDVSKKKKKLQGHHTR